MTSSQLVLRSVRHYWRTNLAVVLGVAAAVSVLSGALVVGDSVRGSLRDIALGRLGNTDYALSSMGFFREGLAADLRGAGGLRAAPLISTSGMVTLEKSGRRAAGIQVYGVDARFWEFHGLGVPSGTVLSPALASELAAAAGDALLVRLQKPSAIPIESLFGRKDDIGRTLRLDVGSVLPRERLGEFALYPQQAEVRAVFAPLTRVQRDLGVPGRVNTVLVDDTDSPPREPDEAVAGAAVGSALTLEDLGATVTVMGKSSFITVESGNGVLGPPLEAAALDAGRALGLAAVPIYTYLATTIRRADRQIPYSLITATDLNVVVRGAVNPLAVDDDQPAPGGLAPDAVLLNEWAARDLGASIGDPLEVEYLMWDPGKGLTTHTAGFTVAGVVPLAGFAADRQLLPEYPGITEATSLASWDPPFPVDLSRVRPQDEEYWDRYRTAPKAFIPFERGRELWRTRYGSTTSVRFTVPAGSDAENLAGRLRTALRRSLSPGAMGVSVVPARRLAIEASTGTTDFGQYFTYFSFFLVVSALMLAVLFFRLGIEQRLRQIGVLRASGFTVAHVRRLLMAEAVALAAAGSAIGAAGAVGYGLLIVHALRTWWVGAVGTTLLTLHVTPLSLAIGALAGIAASALCVVISLRAVARLSPRALLNAQALDASAPDARRARRTRAIGAAVTLAGIVMLAVGSVYPHAQSGMFFGAGASLLVAALCFWSSWLRHRDARPLGGRGAWSVWRLGFRGAAFRPSRSVLSAALIASAAFIIVSVEAFRKGGAPEGGDLHSGTGGFALIGRSELPLLHSPNDAAGREALGLADESPVLVQARFTRFRLRAGEDTSCLNLYRPTNPTIVAPEPGFIESSRFSFASSMAQTEAERANPWLLLQRPSSGVVPVIADATSLQYVLHAGVGDTFALQTAEEAPIVLQFVGALADSVLQGELVMSEENFIRLFPAQQGYRSFLIDAPGARSAPDVVALAGALERELAPYGFDAVTAAERLEAFHRVENTYLSTFQALGGLGLVLGTFGLAAIMFRNVLERRRELALLRAVGYDARRIGAMMMAEATLLLGVGLAAGAGSAVLAVAPAWFSRGGVRPGAGLLALLLAVAAAGLLSSFIATRAALRGNMLEALRAE
ncbi:MAG: ABC transporter permease [Acidobacteriota bacterium]|nr:ABC transporter permease [Acidobacteriota bacterium]